MAEEGQLAVGEVKVTKQYLVFHQCRIMEKFRFTEQGEVINYRYGSHQIAKRHLEQIICAQIISLSTPQKYLRTKILLIK